MFLPGCAQVQQAARATSNYTVGYSAKMQMIGREDVRRVTKQLELSQTNEITKATTEGHAIHAAGKRLAKLLAFFFCK